MDLDLQAAPLAAVHPLANNIAAKRIRNFISKEGFNLDQEEKAAETNFLVARKTCPHFPRATLALP